MNLTSLSKVLCFLCASCCVQAHCAAAAAAAFLVPNKGSGGVVPIMNGKFIRPSLYTPKAPLGATGKDSESDDNDGGEETVSDQVLKSLTSKLSTDSADSIDDALAPPSPTKKKDNKSMAFLRKIGRVGGAANKNFVNAVGSDEGSTGRQPPAQRSGAGGGMKKDKSAYRECTASGIIDDMTEPFPLTCSGTEWRGVSDRVMGGVSDGFIKRETELCGEGTSSSSGSEDCRTANVLTGHVSLDNGGGFIQMVTDLSLDPARSVSVDASDYDGIELDVLCRGQPEEEGPLGFNVHLRTPGTFQQASYRHTCTVEDENAWTTVRIPFTSFSGYGADDLPPLDISALRRIGIVAIGREMDVFVAVAGVRFYTVI